MIKRVDDQTGQDIANGRGVDVLVILVGEKTPRQLNFTKWNQVPNGTWDGKPILSMTVKDVEAIASAAIDISKIKGRTNANSNVG